MFNSTYQRNHKVNGIMAKAVVVKLEHVPQWDIKINVNVTWKNILHSGQVQRSQRFITELGSQNNCHSVVLC